MAADRHERVSELFLQASELPADQRAAWLAEWTGDDVALREEVEELLAFGDGDAFVDTGPAATIWAGAAREVIDADVGPTSIGPYEILGELGRGGMGAVYRARQASPAREVALKIVRPDFANDATLRRFEVEAELLGRLRHPGIAQVYEAGVALSEGGSQPYFAMELIDGSPLDAWAHERSLDLRARLELIAKVADAVQHAHQRGVLHRDLKPANVLVDEHGQPKVLDFGVARATDENATLLTHTGQLVGTLAYMSPEQIRGEADARSDVYALGAIAYQLVCGRLPIEVAGLSLPEAARKIVENEPSMLGSLDRELRGDIETIVAKALEKDPTRRYGSAAQLAADLRRYLNDEPISARPQSTIYQLSKLARRHRALFAGVGIAVAALIVGLVASLMQTQRAWAAKQRSDDERQESETVVRFLSDLLASVDADELGRDARVVDVLDRAARELEATIREHPGTEARLQSTIGRAFHQLGEYDRALEHLERAYALLDTLEEDEQREALSIRSYFAETLVLRGDYERARDQLAENRTLAEELEGPLGPSTLGTVAAQANVSMELGELERAEELIDETLPRLGPLEAESSQAHFDLIVARQDLLHLSGDLEGSFEILERVLSEAREAFGESDGRTLSLEEARAQRLFELGRPAEAEERFRWLRERYVERHGERHDQVLQTEIDLAATLEFQARYEEAEALARRVFEVRSETLGEDSIGTLIAMGVLERICASVGKLAEAHELAQELFARRTRTLGEGHPETVLAAMNLAKSTWRMKEYRRAGELYEQAHDSAVRHLPGDHPYRIQTTLNLANYDRNVGRYEPAMELLDELLPKCRELYGEDDLETLQVQRLLGLTLAGLKRHDEAEVELRAALEGTERAVGPNNPFTLRAMAGLSAFYLETGQPLEAGFVLEDAIERATDSVGADNPLTVELETMLERALGDGQ